MLEHDDCCAEAGPVRQQLEGERRRDLVGDVGHTDVKEREALLHDIPLDDLQMHSITVNKLSLDNSEHSCINPKRRIKAGYLEVGCKLCALHAPLQLQNLHVKHTLSLVRLAALTRSVRSVCPQH